jgi:hypothetical protein
MFHVRRVVVGAVEGGGQARAWGFVCCQMLAWRPPFKGRSEYLTFQVGVVVDHAPGGHVH